MPERQITEGKVIAEQYPAFSKIIKHLDRKKPNPDWGIEEPIKPKYTFDDHLQDEGYLALYVTYNYYYMTIAYTPGKLNPYWVHIETQCVIRQTVGTRFWTDTWHQQEDVIEYIRYKLR